MEYILNYNGATAIASTFGGELISYKDISGTEYVWTGDKNYWTGHAPVLFPIVGALKNDTILIGEKSYTIAKHGFARKREFKVLEKTDNSIHFILTEDEETLLIYPFKFELHIIHALNEKGFKTEYKVINKSEITMFTCLGGHAGFCCPINKCENFNDYRLYFEKCESITPMFTDEKSILHKENIKDKILDNTDIFALDYDDYDNDVLIFNNIVSRKVSVINKYTNKGFEFLFNGFNSLGIWTPPKKKAPFICLEPWKGVPAYEDETGRFEDKPDVIKLSKNNSYSASYSMNLI